MARIEFDWSDPDRPRTEFFPDPETRFRTADQLIEAEMALLTRESVATGAPPPTHQGPDGPSRGLGWIALAGLAAIGLLWLAYKTVTTFWEVLP